MRIVIIHIVLIFLCSCSSFSSKNEKSPQVLSQNFVDGLGNEKDKREYLLSELFIKANAASIVDDLDTSILLYKKMDTLMGGTSPYVRLKLALELVRNGQLIEAKDILAQIYAKDKQEKVGLVLAGVYTVLAEKISAERIYKGILKKNKQSEDACLFLAKIYAMDQEFNKSLQLLNKCIRSSPKKGVFSYYRGKIYVELEKYHKAKREFKNALRKEPQFYQAALAIGRLYENDEKYNNAIEVYTDYLKKDADNVAILEKIIQNLFALGKYKESITYMEKVIDFFPNNLNLWIKLGILYTDSNQYDKAINIFESILDTAPESNKVLYYLGAIHQEKKNYEASIEVFSKIPLSSHLFSDASLQIAQMLLKLALLEPKGKYQEKLEKFVYQRGVDTPDWKVEYFALLANYYDQIQDYPNAIAVLEKVQKDEKFNDGHRYYLATLLDKDGRFQKAQLLAEEILKNDPENAHAWNFLGYGLLERSENLPLALEYIQKAVGIRPNDGFIRDSLGWYYYKTGQYDLALKEMRMAYRLVGNDAVIMRHLAEVYLSMKNYKKAVKYFQKAFAESKNPDEKNKISNIIKDIGNIKRLPASR